MLLAEIGQGSPELGRARFTSGEILADPRPTYHLVAFGEAQITCVRLPRPLDARQPSTAQHEVNYAASSGWLPASRQVKKAG
jgi:hypothetical protein